MLMFLNLGLSTRVFEVCGECSLALLKFQCKDGLFSDEMPNCSAAYFREQVLNFDVLHLSLFKICTPHDARRQFGIYAVI